MNALCCPYPTARDVCVRRAGLYFELLMSHYCLQGQFEGRCASSGMFSCLLRSNSAFLVSALLIQVDEIALGDMRNHTPLTDVESP